VSVANVPCCIAVRNLAVTSQWGDYHIAKMPGCIVIGGDYHIAKMPGCIVIRGDLAKSLD
jgi:hypothetical protein